MEKTSKVISVQPNGSWSGTFGEMFKYNLSFENGDKGEYSSKSAQQSKFIIGQLSTYIVDVKNPQYPKIKSVFSPEVAEANNSIETPSTSSAAATAIKQVDIQLHITSQSMVKAAIDFHAINPDQDLHPADILKTARIFIDFVYGKDDYNEAFDVQEELDGLTIRG